MTDFETEFARRNALSHSLAMAPCLHGPFADMRETAEISLIRHLPKLCPDDRDWVDPEEIRALIGAMSVQRPDLTIAILKALEQVGDKKAIPPVEGLFRQIGQATSTDYMRMRAVAYDCLLCLRDHASRTRQSQFLLRGSQLPTGGAPSTLLRPAQETDSTASTELLRPSDADA
jgi:hypothetical protein